MSEPTDKPRQRAEIRGAASARLAMASISGIVQNVSMWTEELARARARLGARHETDEDHRAVRRLIEVLKRKIGYARAELSEKLSGLAWDVRRHSRVIDLEKSLASLEAIIAEIEGRLGFEKPR